MACLAAALTAKRTAAAAGVGLGMCRLAIIDLTSPAHQPVSERIRHDQSRL